MRKFTVIFLLLSPYCWGAIANETRPRVPKEIAFAGMRLKLTEAARRDIQKDVDALTQSQKYLEIKADRARLYFPIIEKILEEDGVPGDFKYLALQESALISDAVSSANAVGFWQFKDFTGREVGLRIDKSIDERLNVVSSTHGAAKYFKRHNFFFDNWVYTLLAHMTGRGGAEKYVDHANFGKKKMTLDGKTHWYIKRFLAHKIAFEHVVEEKHSEGMKLTVYTKGRGKTLASIAKSAKVDEAELKRYNKWLKKGKVPEEKVYAVLIPAKGKTVKIKEGKAIRKPTHQPKISPKDEEVIVPKQYSLGADLNVNATIFIKINGLPCILAKASDDLNSLAQQSNLSPERFAMYNDIQVTDDVIEGDIYYIKSKRSKGRTYFYTVRQKETLWIVSQKFGIKLAKLAKLNRMHIEEELKEGRVLWLHKRRPEHMPIEYRNIDTAVKQEEIVSIVEPILINNKPVEVEKELIVQNHKTDTVFVEEDKQKPKKRTKDLVPHTVASGETLYGIAKQYHVSVSEILEWNEMEDTAISEGSVLLVRGRKKIEKLPNKNKVTFHEVIAGDTMYSISRQYDISIDRLLRLNQKENFNLSLGEKLRVKE